MTYNQKIALLMTVFLLGITAAIIFTCFEYPYTTNFCISVGFIFFAEIMFGGFWVQQIGKGDSVLPLSLGNWVINIVYLVWVLFLSVFTSCQTKYFFLWHVVGLCVCVVSHLFFRIVEHHVEELSKDDEPMQKIERAEVTWR